MKLKNKFISESQISCNDLKQSIQVTKAHSMIILIMLLQITLITFGFYVQYEQSYSFERQITDIIDQKFKKYTSFNEWNKVFKKRDLNEFNVDNSSLIDSINNETDFKQLKVYFYFIKI